MPRLWGLVAQVANAEGFSEVTLAIPRRGTI